MGYTVRRLWLTVKVLAGKDEFVSASGESVEHVRIKLIGQLAAQILITGVVLAVCVPAIFDSSMDDYGRKWAVGAVGGVVGYWLR